MCICTLVFKRLHSLIKKPSFSFTYVEESDHVWIVEKNHD